MNFKDKLIKIRVKYTFGPSILSKMNFFNLLFSKTNILGSTIFDDMTLSLINLFYYFIYIYKNQFIFLIYIKIYKVKLMFF